MINLIRAKRQSLGLTQAQFAGKANTPLRTYKRYEADADNKEHRIPDAVTAIRIARALDSTVEELWGNNSKARVPV